MADLQRKTGNLFDKSKRTDNSRVLYTTGEIGVFYSLFVSDFTPIEPNATYTLNIVSSISGKTGHLFALYDENKNFVNTGAHEATSVTVYTFTTPSNVAYIRFNGNMASVDSIMLNTGSTTLPYEPYGWVHSLRKYGTDTDILASLPVNIYADGNNATVGISGNTVQSGTPTPQNPIQPQGCGDLETVGAKAGQYKIPISSASTTTPVYLGEVETTRKIKKLVLTGEEDWVQSVSGVKVYRINVSDYLREIDNIPICTHYKGIAPVAGTGNLQDLETAFLLSSSGTNYCYIRDDRFNNANDFKSYLATQYAAGTPVTVWYILATETTGVVNEPLMRIGDYADTVSGITIPTTAGENSFDVLTTLKPSEVTVNYKGWHPVQSVHERESGAWT